MLEDAGSLLLFDTGFAIHEGVPLEQMIWGEASQTSEPYDRRNLLLYFEHDDVERRSIGSHRMSCWSILSSGRLGGSACFGSMIRTGMWSRSESRKALSLSLRYAPPGREDQAARF